MIQMKLVLVLVIQELLVSHLSDKKCANSNVGICLYNLIMNILGGLEA